MGKLVRDRIPEIIWRETGVYPDVRQLNDEEFHAALVDKLYEELNEYEDSGEIEELADVYEVLRALALHHKSAKSFMSAVIDKEFKRGAFHKRYWLEYE